MPDDSLKMGEVVSKLSWEYEDKITAGAIRFWENKKLLEPAEKTGGGHRLYAEESINWIRLLKELSMAGLSIKEMRERVENVRTDLEGFKKGSRFRTKRLLYFTRVIEMQRRRNILDAELNLFFRLDEKQKLEKVYDREGLLRTIAARDGEDLLRKAEEYRLVKPDKLDRSGRFSPLEEMILRVLSFLELADPDIVEKCENLVSTVRYLTNKVGIPESFPAQRDRDNTSGYNATLYNLVLMNLRCSEMVE